jgi:hypothetical protein
VTIIKPDDSTDVVTTNTFIGDATAWFEYVADQVGTWKLKFEFPGGYFPAGNYTAPPEAFSLGGRTVSFTQSAYYKSCSTDWQTLTVQSDPILSWPPQPLPSDYWTRPISSDHREWSPISGDYPWYGPGFGADWPADTNTYWSSMQRFTPYVQAPDTAHIVWKRQDAIGGIINAQTGQLSYPLAIIGVSNYPRIIYAGRCYQSYTKPGTGKTAVTYWMCYDLRTGEVFWDRPLESGESAPTVIEYYLAGGEAPGAESWLGTGSSVRLVYIGGGWLRKYNPWTGAMTVNASIAPLTTGTYYMNGYALSVQNIGNTTNPNYRLINWTTLDVTQVTTVGQIPTLAQRITNNVTWPFSNIPSTTDFNVGIAASINSPTVPALGAGYGTRIMAADMTTGRLLFNITTDETLMSGTEVADQGKIAFVSRGGNHAIAYNLQDGRLSWTSDQMDYPWGHWNSYTGEGSAYGLMYICGYSAFYAFNWTTGKIAWKYYAPAQNPYESVYTDETGQAVYSFAGACLIADGKVFAYNSEHTVTQPITRGWGLHCINAITGEGIWNISGVSSPGAVADGYLAAGSLQDGYMYVFGKGKSETTVAATDTVVPKGTGVVIKGTVLDMSPAQPGTPCVSAASMKTQMEYLHMQMPQDGLYHDLTVTGVPVKLTAIEPDGNAIDLGSVTSDMRGTFGYAWTPQKEGLHKIIATFAGDGSYGSSWAETYVSVGPAPATTTTEQQVVPDNTSTIIGTGIGVGIAMIIAVAIVGALLLRKRS